jgi:DNA-binding transcriptional LysR family regulator
MLTASNPLNLLRVYQSARAVPSQALNIYIDHHQCICYHLPTHMRANVSDLDLRLLRIFIAVVDAKGLSDAQTTLNIGQPTISTHLATLEARVGFRLCERGRSGFHLTPRGEKFVAAARSLLSTITDFGISVRNMDKTLVGNLRIGLIDHAPTTLLQQVSSSVAAFRKRSEAVRFSLSVRPPRDLEDQLIHGELDLAFSYFWRHLPRMEYRNLFKERQIACCGRGHPLFSKAGMVLAEEAADHEWTWRSYPLPNAAVVRPHDSVTAVADDMEAVAILIMSGRYLGYLPEEFAEPYIGKKLLAPLNPKLLRYDVKFEMVHPRQTGKDDVLLAFLQDLKQAHT